MNSHKSFETLSLGAKSKFLENRKPNLYLLPKLPFLFLVFTQSELQVVTSYPI